MTKTLSKCKYVLLLFVLMATSGMQSFAQSPCQMTNGIVINTGYNPATGTAIGIGTTDPKWSISYLSPDLATIAAPTTVGSAPFAVTPHPAWATPGANSRYLSSVATTGYTTVSTSTGYTMTIRRTFRTCVDDQIRLDMRFSGDDTVVSILVDGSPVYVNPGFPTIGFMSSVSTTIPMTAGTHTIAVTLGNIVDNYPNNTNFSGVDLTGTVTSAGGLNSIVSDISDPKCTCGNPCGKLKGLNICTDVIANPFTYTFTPNFSPVTTNYIIDYGDGSAPVYGSGNTPVSYTYASNGSYFVTITILDANKKPCDKYSFELCISKSGAKPEPAYRSSNATKTKLREPFPNPASNSVNVPVSGSEEKIKVSLVGQDGKILMSKTIQEKNDAVIELSTSGLAPGIYFLHIIDGQGTRVKPFTQL